MTLSLVFLIHFILQSILRSVLQSVFIHVILADICLTNVVKEIDL